MDDIYKTYPHNPPHCFVPNAMYIVTGSLLYKQRLLTDDKRKSIVCEILFERAEHLGWELDAWAVLENHYHFCSYQWFLDKTDDAFRNTVMGQPIDRVDIFDDFD